MPHVRADIRDDVKTTLEAAMPSHTVFAARRYKINDTELPVVDMRFSNENSQYGTMGRTLEREASLYVRVTRIASEDAVDDLLDADAVLIEEAIAAAPPADAIWCNLVQTNFTDGGDANRVVAEIILRYDIGYRTDDDDVTTAKG